MFLVDYEQDTFTVSPVFNSIVDRETYDEVLTYFKQLFLYYNNKINKWKIPSDRIDEILLWFERDNKPYEISYKCGEQIEELQKQYSKKELKFFRDIKFDPSILNEGVECINDQEEDINWSLQRSGYIDAHKPGCGKTFINICTFSTLYDKGLIDGIVIVVPIGLGFNWENSILDFVKLFKKDDILIIDNLLKVRPFENAQNKKILIIRQDLYADVIASYNKTYNPKKSLKNLKWKTADYVDIKKIWNKEKLFFIADEAHSFKNTNAIKTKSLFSTKKYYDYKALLTATPAINGIEDMYSYISFIDKSIIPMSENAFKLWISTKIGNKWDRYAITNYNAKNVQTFMQSYQHIFIQKELKTNHKKIDKTIRLQLLPEQEEMYEIVVENEIKILQEEYDEITWKLLLSKLHLMLEVFDNPLLLSKRQYNDIRLQKLILKWKIENDPKFIFLKERLYDLIEVQNKKVVVYDIHPFTLDLLNEKFSKYNPLLIHGELKVKNKDKDRTEKEYLFNHNSKHKLMLLSAYTSSAGINLQVGSSNVIYYTLSWDALHLEQGSCRTHRITSTKDSLIEIPFYPYTLDSVRLNKNFNRVEFNSRMGDQVSQRDIERLLNGTYN